MIERNNFLWVQDYLRYLRDTKGLKEKSVERYRFHLNHLLEWAGETLLSNSERIRPSLPVHVRQLVNKKNSLELSAESQSRIIETARQFFKWAKIHVPNFRNLEPRFIDALRLPKSENQLPENEYVTLDEIRQIASMKVDPADLVLQRDQAAAVMLFLSGMRASAFVTAPIQAFDLPNNRVYQFPKEYGVQTKNGKKATTFLLPIPDLLEVVASWDGIVRSSLPPTEPWYAPIKNEWGEHSFSLEPIGRHRGAGLNKRLRQLFKAVGLRYKSAHKFRHGHAVFGLKHSNDMESYKAVSQNLMHSDIKITDGIYARLRMEDVGARIASLGVGAKGGHQ